METETTAAAGERSRTIPPNSINTLNGAEEKDESRARRGTKRAKERLRKVVQGGGKKDSNRI